MSDTASTKIVTAIGLVGLKASGKDELCRILAALGGFVTYRLSDAIRAELRALGETDPSTPRLQDYSNQRKAETGDAGIWGGRVLEIAASEGKSLVIMNGIRNPGEIASARRVVGDRLILVGITASFNVRAERYLARKQDGDVLTLGAFQRLDARDRGAGEPPDGQQVDACMALVPPHNLYDNSGSLEDFRSWVRDWYWSSQAMEYARRAASEA